MKDKDYIVMQLKCADPDYLVDLFNITSEELLLAFPEKLEGYLDETTQEQETIYN
jgi:hypothetical protein